MIIFYLSYVYTFFFLSFGKEKIIRKLLFPLLIPFILVFSLRSSPDEYDRYLALAVPDNFSNLGFGIGSQWLFNLICQICQKFYYPRALLYLISYSLMFFLLNKSIKYISNKSYSISFFSLAYYLSHLYITFFEGVRGSLANIIGVFAVCYFIKSNRVIPTIIILYLAVSVHIQTFPLLMIFITFSLFRYIYKRFKLIKFKQVRLLTFSISLITLALAIIFRSSIANLSSNLIYNSSFFSQYTYYLFDTTTFYVIDIFSIRYLALVFVNILVLFLSYKPIFTFHNKRYRILFFLVLSGQIISLSFSNFALLAYRISSSFLYFQVLLIAVSISAENKNIFKTEIFNRKIIFLCLAMMLSIYNTFIQGHLNSWVDPIFFLDPPVGPEVISEEYNL